MLQRDMRGGNKLKPFRQEFDEIARLLLQAVDIELRVRPEKTSVSGSHTGAIAYKVNARKDKNMSAILSRHRDLEPGRNSYGMPQSTTVSTRIFKLDPNSSQYTHVDDLLNVDENWPDLADLPGIKFVAGKKEFTLHPGDGSVYMMTGSANAHFTHQVTCTPSKSGQWLRVCVPTFLFWDESQERVSNKRQRTT